ncbi:MAG: twitching motility protein PilT [Actinomycetota bacterium]|jgi:twitching motility protein PilT|nr:twitching motility protein PilT [Actinomycetota bacterium]
MAKTGTLRAEDLLEELWQSKGTDLLLTPGVAPMIRIDGDLTRLEDHVGVTPADTEALMRELLTEQQAALFDTGSEVDFSFTWRDSARLRGNAFRTKGSIGLSLRLIPHTIPTFEDLGLPEVMGRFAQLRQGLVLVTGPTGSGKSTTLASIIDRINATRACHIITIEDPIEYVYEHKMAAVNQREVGDDTESFPKALRSALREDPDVLLVGEMRDLESIAFALTLAETGHLVFATLHTNDTAQALDRIVDVFPSDRQAQIRVQLANALTGIVYQRLLPRLGGGLVAAYEVLVANSAVRNLVKEGKTNQLRNVVSTHQTEGMQTLEKSLTELVAQGVVDIDQARLVSLYPKDVEAPLLQQADLSSRQRRRGR